MENTYGKYIFMGSLAARTQRAFCRCCWFLLVSYWPHWPKFWFLCELFASDFLEVKIQTQSLFVVLAWLQVFSRDLFLYLVPNFLACAHTYAFLAHFSPEPCGPWRAGAQAFQPGPLGTRWAFPPPLPQSQSLIKAWLLWPSAPPFVSGFWAFPLRESVPR